MRSSLLALAACTVMLVGLAVPAHAVETAQQTTHDCIESVPDPDTGDAVSICYTLHRPAGASAQSPVPMVMHGHAWGSSRGRSAASFTPWLSSGFGVLSFDHRGFGESGGLAQIQSPDVEGQDVIRLVDVVASLDWVAKEGAADDPVLGAIGGSYGGGYQLNGALTELRDTGTTRFDALVPEVTWHDLPTALAPDGVPRTAWLAVLQAYAAQDMSTAVRTGFAYASSTGRWPGAGSPFAHLDGFLARSGPAWHLKQGRRLDIPVLFRQGITDTLVNLNQGLSNFDQLLTPAARERSLFVGYNGGHVLTSTLPIGTDGVHDPCAARLGGGYFAALSLRFLQESLQGASTGLTGHGGYHLASTRNTCMTVETVEPSVTVSLGPLPVTTATGGPVSLELARGPIRVAGRSLVDAAVTAVGGDSRAFLGLSVGTSSADAELVAGNVMPINVPDPVLGQAREIELPAVAVDVPKGKKLFLTLSPFSETFASHGGGPGALVLESIRVHLPVQVQE